MHDDRKLSEHFTLGEMATTEVRRFQAVNLDYARKHIKQLRKLCTWLEDIREVLGGTPLIIHSGIRCPELNAYIGGTERSQHMLGEAVDFHPALPMQMTTAFERIWEAQREGALSFGQLLLEDGDDDGEYSWIHLSLGSPWREAERCNQVARVNGRRFSWLQR
jgi:hypothetical protein